MIKPLSLKSFPYSTSNEARILKPDFEKKSWKMVADYAAPAEKNVAPVAKKPVAKPAVTAPAVKAKATKKPRNTTNNH